MAFEPGRFMLGQADGNDLSFRKFLVATHEGGKS
jgi:hypothetical protein